MRPNPYGAPHLSRSKEYAAYYWVPPIKLRQIGLFRHAALGSDFTIALARAKELNKKIDAYRLSTNPPKPELGPIKPVTVGYLVRQFEASPKFAQYASRTKEEYVRYYRNMEVQNYGGKKMFGDMKLHKITRQFAYSLYELCVRKHGIESARKMVNALRAAYKYGTLRIPGLSVNPFSQLGMQELPPRRQRWTNGQLTAFIKKADEMGFPSIGRCALMCMELVQRPGDMLSLRWGAFQERDGVWYIHQSKRGVEVRVPPTKRLKLALNGSKLINAKLEALLTDASAELAENARAWKLAYLQMHEPPRA